uniref:Uncharacterized protein n=1 Tax=Grammatophora oceanica TaxID=210454 RepID=A0A7S1VHT8_9STRA|mmetsp:Transcript_46959/g.69845  ORF Transcript_46959/g.69845 Transcript_46959/m.69845 type:complete len:478 (+) Transcript_46959:151-1584(+)|eukprot:CAMPEP_0194049388 /NCGR_PEP_ID=MMETSP0009_2-20130614/30581_1 /TAXON_ID=210454 /ORGANISM="Grammatophora oceanica, Strain CCMP 410" /LENGTH=477 /DNA_ID=CAMNT_0038695535 /DNA_START=119 /DNA_END=1552 /DNA_ORIENTATION=-
MDRNWLFLHSGEKHVDHDDRSPDKGMTLQSCENAPASSPILVSDNEDESAEESTIEMKDTTNTADSQPPSGDAGCASLDNINEQTKDPSTNHATRCSTDPGGLHGLFAKHANAEAVNRKRPSEEAQGCSTKQRSRQSAQPADFDTADLLSCVEQLGIENQYLREEIGRLYRRLEGYHDRQVVPLERALIRVTRERNSYKRKLDRMGEKYEGRLLIQQDAHKHALKQYQNVTDMYKERLADAVTVEEEKQGESHDFFSREQKDGIMMNPCQMKKPCQEEVRLYSEEYSRAPMEVQGQGEHDGSEGLIDVPRKMVGASTPSSVAPTQAKHSALVVDHLAAFLRFSSRQRSLRHFMRTDVEWKETLPSVGRAYGGETSQRHEPQGLRRDVCCPNCLSAVTICAGFDMNFWLHRLLEECLANIAESEQVAGASFVRTRLGQMESRGRSYEAELLTLRNQVERLRLQLVDMKRDALQTFRCR